MENENYKGIISSPEEPLQNNSQQPVEDEMDEDSAAKERLTSTDPTKVVFTSANSEYTRKNGDAKVDIENVQRSVGMGKEELLKYANEPFWVRLRMTLFVLFWVIWVAMLIGSVAIIVIVPGCPAAPRLEWWQKSTIYQVMVGSFKDSDGDKKGDLNGLTSKMDYFSDLKVDAILLGSIFSSPAPDEGVLNFTDIANQFGTFTDFKNLVQKSDEKNIKIILEFIPNHTSDKHPWFQKSIKGEEPFADYYIWVDSKEGDGQPGELPNNWQNLEGSSAWNWNGEKKKFYLSQHRLGLPDLNLRNANVRKELKEILRFWLDEGVDGFKVMDVDLLFEDSALRNESGVLEKADRIYTRSLPENLELLREWREMLDNYTDLNEQKHPRILLTESAEGSYKSPTAFYYGKKDDPVVDIPYNMGLTKLNTQSTPLDLQSALQSSFNNTPPGLWPNFVLGTSRHARLFSRVGSSLLDGVHMAALLSKGTPVVFFGDELGMNGTSPAKAQNGEAGSTTLMPWDNTTLAGNGEVGATVDAEQDRPHSHLSIFKHLLSLREKPAISFGEMDFPLVNERIFSMLRVKKGTPGYLVVINFSGNETEVDFSEQPQLPEVANVELATPVTAKLTDTGHPKVKLSEVIVGPHQAAVLTFVPKDK